MNQSNIHFIVQTLPAKEAKFRERLKILSEKASFHNPHSEGVPAALQELQQYRIRQCVVGPKHFAFLLEDGKVCRLKYSAHDGQDEEVETEPAPSTSTSTKSSTTKLGERPAKLPRTGNSPWILSGTDLSSGGSSALRRWGTHIGVIRSMASSSSDISSRTASSTTSSRNRGRNNRLYTAAALSSSSIGVRLVRTSQLRGRGLQSSLLTGQRAIVPASHVPEELVNQVQGILQGKSRNIIIRELQKTNLDVNLAVNNLLSRDDEDNDDMDDNGNDYMPGEDLLSLLDSGIHPGEHGVFFDTEVLPEDLLGYTLHRASRTSANQRSGVSGSGETGTGGGREPIQDRDPIIRLGSPRFFEPLRPYESDQDESSQQSKSSAAKKTKLIKKSASVSVGEELEWWLEDEEYTEFIEIGAMESELVAVDVLGNLRQWVWSKESPYCHKTMPKIFHPLTQFLCLEDKKVVHLAACSLRASVLVENGGVATWIDHSVARHASVLEHPVTACVDPDLAISFNSKKQKETENKCLHVCSLYTAVFTSSGEIYWWGVLPFHLRKKILEKAQNKLKKIVSSRKQLTAKKNNEVKLGSLVCLHSCPMFQAGAIAIHTRGGKPKVGCLQQSAWDLTDKCIFKILKKRKKKNKRKEKKKESDHKGVDSTDDPDLTMDKPTVATKEIPAIQSTSERETVLKSTSGAAVVQSSWSKPQKRKHSEKKSKPTKDILSAPIYESLGWEDVGETEEMWNLQDVIFIEDLPTVPVGKVLKVDGDMVAVLFSKSGKFSDEKSNKRSILKNLRLLRKEDVHVLTSNASPKVPECFLKTPRKITLDSSLKIHSICVNELGIEAIEGGINGSRVRLLSINMLGKVSSDALPTSPEMFLGCNQKQSDEIMSTTLQEICKLDRNCQDFFTLLRDRYSCLYPLLRNDVSGIRDPLWLNLTPLTTVGMGTHVQVDSNQKRDKTKKPKMLVVSTLVFKSYLLMPMIILRDHKSVQQLLEKFTANDIQAVCEERCDGQRNILHVAVSVTAPTSNQNEDAGDKGKEDKEPKKRDSYRSIPQVVSTSTTLVSTADTGESRITSAASSSPMRSAPGGSQLSSQSERVDAVNALANAISVVTRGERSSSATRPRSSSSRDNRSTYPPVSDQSVVSLPAPPYRPLSTRPPLASSGYSSRLMRDIMQQFAAVLDDHPVHSRSSTAPTSTSSTSSISSSSIRRMPAIIREAREIGADESMETIPSSYRSSPTPAIPTSVWPPERIFTPNAPCEEGLNLSTGQSGSSSSNRYSSKSSKKPKRKRSPTPPTSEPPALKWGTQADALAIIKTLCSAKVLQPHLFDLSSQRDALGHTPFMSAIYLRAYPAAVEILQQCHIIAKKRYDILYKEKEDLGLQYDCSNPKYNEILMSMIYPSGSDPDANPLYVLCANDTCSFTWTGEQHINQDIFECWTCGLTGTLCCCSECARVCHNGHDCKLKRTSPTAYCDCWEKCACRSLIAGDTATRAALLQILLHETKLAYLVNARGETVLQFLAQTVARQSVEQRQHRTHTTASALRANPTPKPTTANDECDIPQHDLQPPTFCREAFLSLLHDWNSVRATIMSNCPGHMDPLCASSLPELFSGDAVSFLLPEEQQCMASQTGTSRLDSFTQCLLVKCSTMYLDMLLETFINQIQKISSDKDKNDDKEVVHRFVRSLVRIFVVLGVCSTGKPVSRTVSSMQPQKRLKRAFIALLPIAVEELCEMAKAVIDPVRLGIAKPTSPFSILPNHTDVLHSCENAFARLPFPPRGEAKKKKNRETRRRDRSGRENSSPTFRLMESSSRRNLARRGSNHHRSQNNESLRTASGAAVVESAERESIARDVIQEALEDDLVRINRQIRAEGGSTLLEDDYQLLTDDEDDNDAPEWQNVEDGNENHEQDTQEETSSQIAEEGHGEPDAPLDDSAAHDVSQDPADGPLQNDAEPTQAVAKNSPDADESQQDLDMEDADGGREEDQEEAGDGNPHDDEESDMDLTLIAGSDRDTDAESNQSGGEDQEEQHNDDNAQGRNDQGGILYLEDDEGMSEDVAEDDGGDDDDDNQDDDDDDGDNFTKTSDDEAATATEPEENGSSQEEDEDANDDDQDEEEMDSQSELVEFPLERAPTRQQRSRVAMAPHSMRWALGGSRPATTQSGSSASGSGQTGPGSVSSGGNFIYIDPLAIRRTNTAGVGSSVTPGGPLGDSGKQGSVMPDCSAATTNAQLARAFGICIREIATLFTTVRQGDHISVSLSTFLELTNEDIKALEEFVEKNLSETWKWLLTVIDSNEAQLRYGQVVALAGSPDHVDHPLHKGGNDGNSRLPTDRRGGVTSFTRPYIRTARDSSSDSHGARQDFLSYIMSLMRAHSGEHSDYLPVIDVSSMRHIAYVLDALIFYLRETSSVFADDAQSKRKRTNLAKDKKLESPLNIGYDNTDDEDEEDMDDPPEQESSNFADELYSLAVSDVLVGDIIANAQERFDPTIVYAQPQKSFFRRSESMTFIGCADPDPFTDPLVKALPLADKPHLLQPNARKEELFGRPRQQIGGTNDPTYFDPDLPGTGMGQLKHKIPAKFENLKEIKRKMEEDRIGAVSSMSIRRQAENQELEGPSSATDPDKETPPAVLPEQSDKTKTESKEAKSMEIDKPQGHTQEFNKSSELKDGDVTDLSAPPVQSVIVKMEAAKGDKQLSEPPKKVKPTKRKHFTPPSVDALFSRCRLTLELFTKVFLDDVGAEPKSILQELGGFEVREAKFRKEMEKLRNSQTVDLQLNVEREPHRLIMQTFKQLNQHFRRRTGSSTALSTMSQPLAVQRVKVIFKDEPGEGSGVARSFYTALCEALLSSDKLPPLDPILVPLGPSSSLVRLRKRDQERERALGRAGGKKVNLRSYFMARYAQQNTALGGRSGVSSAGTSIMTSLPQISTLSPPFYKQSRSSPGINGGGWSRDKRAIGDRLLPKVNAINPGWSKKITGMLLSLPVSELLLLLSSENILKNKVHEASRRLTLVRYTGEDEDPNASSKDAEDSSSNENAVTRNLTHSTRATPSRNMPSRASLPNKDKNENSDSDHESDDEEAELSNFPLFYQPGKRGFYSPCAGPTLQKSLKDADSDSRETKNAQPLADEARLNAFRNVGRIFGLCLLQNELCPLPLNRHVLKALLGRKINWHDFAFLDPVMYESMRFILAECESPDREELLLALELTFVANLLPEEGGGEIELIPGGSSVSVTPDNIRDYVRRYTICRMITCCHKFIDQMKEGLFDVLPRNSLDGLTAEDLRLLANGCGRVNVRTLISYTSFNDESGKSAGSNTEKLTEFKRWFWSVVERMGHVARQELLYFWTGSPALPASEDGFQPMPTVTLRPPDDHHLPTANTCISRLYVPIYSSRTILKQKLMIAIETKNFGFV